MKFESTFNKRSLLDNTANNKREKPSNWKEKAGAIILVALTGFIYGKFTKDRDENLTSREQKTESNKESQNLKKGRNILKTHEPRKPSPVKSALRYDPGKKIKIGPIMLDKPLTDHFKERFVSNDEFKDALIRMGPWQERIEKIFEEEGVPKQYAYITLAESNFRYQTDNPLAQGPYQFTPETGDKYGLIRSQSADLRCDPLLSARATARYCKNVYELTKDWRFIPPAFNGGYFWQYLKLCKEKNVKINFDDFIAFMEQKANNAQEMTRTAKQYKYKVPAWECKLKNPLEAIAKERKVSLDRLCSANSINKDYKPKPGQEIIIPLSDYNSRSAYFETLSGDIRQNLEYSGKIEAISQMYKEGYFKAKTLPHKFITITTEAIMRTNVSVAKKTESVKSFCKRTGINEKELKKLNPKLHKNTITEGQKILLGTQKSTVTLEELAQRNKIPLKIMEEINPGIIKSRLPLPEGYKLRIPSMS